MSTAQPEVEVDANETAQTREAQPWLTLLHDAEQCFSNYHDKCDNIEKIYADLDQLTEGGEREFQIFWANMEVVKPSIYSRTPIPVVTPRFKDRKPVPRKAAEMLERALISDFEADEVHATLELVRDDLAVCGRGVAWLSVQVFEQMPRATVEHIDRMDFRHSPARKWAEVDWVARRVYLPRKRMLQRFGDIALEAQYTERGLGGDRDEQTSDYKGERTAQVWEIWHKTENVVVWVTEGVEEVLDIQEPFLQLTGFFPCPRPAYATLKPATLLPVPDFAYYKDQVEEINELTARIGALAESLVVRGFYPQGQASIGGAIEHALNVTDNRQLLIGVPDLAQFSGQGGGKLVEFWPIEVVAAAVAQLVELRRQLIEDVYQITGISDIMRGETEASETATAQNIKAQYGSIRIRTKQEEMVRFARDVTRLKAEIMAEQFDAQTLLAMSQVEDLPQAAQLQEQATQLQMAAQQGNQQAAAQMQELQNTVTIDAVMQLLQEQRLRPFVLEIETDSTIQPNEDAEKQRRTEFLAAVGGMAQQALPMVERFPASAGIVVEMLKFAAGGFRAGRELEGEIDEFGEQAKAAATQAMQQPQQDPAAQQAQAEMQLKQKEIELKQQEAQAKLQFEQSSAQQEFEMERQKMAAEFEFQREKFAAEMELKREQMLAEIELKREAAELSADVKREANGLSANA